MDDCCGSKVEFFVAVKFVSLAHFRLVRAANENCINDIFAIHKYVVMQIRVARVSKSREFLNRAYVHRSF
jgi:hypothetical protein